MKNSSTFIKLKPKNQTGRFFRREIPIIFGLMVIAIGIEFMIFTPSPENGNENISKHPAKVEAFLFIIALLFSGYTAGNLSDKWVYRILMEIYGNYLSHFDDFRCQHHRGQLHLSRERCRDFTRISAGIIRSRMNGFQKLKLTDYYRSQ